MPTSKAQRPSPSSSPSPWICRFLPLMKSKSRVLDLACGSGRHLRLLHALGHRVTGLDRDLTAVADLRDTEAVELLQADLEDAPAFPLAGRQFDAVLVTNYLHRPLLPALVAPPTGCCSTKPLPKATCSLEGPGIPTSSFSPENCWKPSGAGCKCWPMSTERSPIPNPLSFSVSRRGTMVYFSD